MNELAEPKIARIGVILGAVAPGNHYTLFVLFLVNFLNYFDRIVPAAVLEPIRQEFSLNDTQLGLVTTAFTVVYALFAIPMGQLADGRSRKKILAVGVGVWSLFTAASGLAAGFVSFMAARMGVGFGEASCTPAATSLIGDLLPQDRRARAYGFFMLGLPLGTFAALLLVGLVAADYGWRAAFMLAALPGAVVALMLLVCVEPRRGRHDPAGQASGLPSPMRAIMSSRLFWSIGLVGVALSMAGYAMRTYLPAFFSRTYGLGIAEAGAAAAIVLGATGIIGLIVGGAISDRVAARRLDGRVLLGAVASLLAAPLVYVGLNTVGVKAATVTLAVGWTLYFVYLVTAHTTLIDHFDSRLRGRAVGVFVFLATVGAAAGSVLAGSLSDHFAQAAAVGGAGAAVARSVGLQQALSLVVPGGLLLGALGYLAATMSLRKQREVK